MSKLILLMIISCILVFASAQKQFLKPITPCKKKYCVYKVVGHFCVKYDDGSIKDLFKNCLDPPCGKNIVGYFPGFCRELQNESYVQN